MECYFKQIEGSISNIYTLTYFIYFFFKENMVKNRFYSYIKRVVLGEKNPYQVIHNQGQMEQEFSDQNSIGSYDRNPYSENNSVSYLIQLFFSIHLGAQ